MPVVGPARRLPHLGQAAYTVISGDSKRTIAVSKYSQRSHNATVETLSPQDGIRHLQRQEAEPPRLLAYLAAVPDPRSALGRRHPLVAILALAAAAVLGGARSFAAIAEWATDAPQPVRTGAGRYVMACLRNLVIDMLSRAGAG
jgi:hypothetical protein